MRGGFIHSQVVARDLVAALRLMGAKVRTEYPVRPGSRPPAVDIYAELAGLRIACEIELGPRRVLADVVKAEELKADWLLIVTATRLQANAIRRRLNDTKSSQVRIQVLPIGAALRFLSDVSRVPSLSNEGTNTSQGMGERKP